MMKIYETDNLIDAQLVCDWLVDDGITSQVCGGYLSGAAGELPATTLISVWIQDAIYSIRARELIDQFKSERNAPGVDQECPACGEHVEGNYSLCWNCGKPLA